MALALTLQLFTAPTPPCPPPLINTWGVLCVTETEWQNLWHPVPPPPKESLKTAPTTPFEAAKRLIAVYFPPWAVNAAMKVVGCETGHTYNPNAWNRRSGASGLFQHMPRYWAERSSKAGWTGASIFDAEANIAVAAWLWGQTGTWQHWSCKP